MKGGMHSSIQRGFSIANVAWTWSNDQTITVSCNSIALMSLMTTYHFMFKVCKFHGFCNFSLDRENFFCYFMCIIMAADYHIAKNLHR